MPGILLMLFTSGIHTSVTACLFRCSSRAPKSYSCPVLPLGISGTFNFMLVFQAEHNTFACRVHRPCPLWRCQLVLHARGLHWWLPLLGTYRWFNKAFHDLLAGILERSVGALTLGYSNRYIDLRAKYPNASFNNSQLTLFLLVDRWDELNCSFGFV